MSSDASHIKFSAVKTKSIFAFIIYISVPAHFRRFKKPFFRKYLFWILTSSW